jgi:hypothetical protein
LVVHYAGVLSGTLRNHPGKKGGDSDGEEKKSFQKAVLWLAWIHIRTSNPIESAFSSIRLRTAKMRSCGSRTTDLNDDLQAGAVGREAMETITGI